MTTLRTVDFEEGIRPFAIPHDGRKAYVQLSYFHGFHEYDIADDRITQMKDLPARARKRGRLSAPVGPPWHRYFG